VDSVKETFVEPENPRARLFITHSAMCVQEIRKRSNDDPSAFVSIYLEPRTQRSFFLFSSGHVSLEGRPVHRGAGIHPVHVEADDEG